MTNAMIGGAGSDRGFGTAAVMDVIEGTVTQADCNNTFLWAFLVLGQ